jgi:hypothetical protein
MSIELLYILPIIALVIFAFSVSYIAQKRSDYLEEGKQLAMEVRQFNDGKFISQERTTEARLDEFELTISSINKALANQQKVIENFQAENTKYNGEIGQLKKKLRELHKEHDIVVSENYSLRAKYNHLVKNAAEDTEHAPNFIRQGPEPEAGPIKRPSQSLGTWEKGMSVLDETKSFSTNVLDDTSVIDISDLLK